jgi:hypothetical protein
MLPVRPSLVDLLLHSLADLFFLVLQHSEAQGGVCWFIATPGEVEVL